jgi:DNA-binding NarL/FixJ family response regulator
MTIRKDAYMTARRLLIVDDVSQVRADLRTLLPLAGDIEIVGEAANGLEAVRQVDVLQPDVVLMDLEMPVMSGYEAIRRIKSQFPACRVIALTVHGYPEALDRACQSGADAFVVKGAPLASLVQEIITKGVSIEDSSYPKKV